MDKILLVCQRNLSREAIHALLERNLAGVLTISCPPSTAAVTARSCRPAIVIVDTDGHEEDLLFLEKSPDFGSPVMIALSCCGPCEARARAAGFQVILSKNVDGAELTAKVNEILASAAANTPPPAVERRRRLDFLSSCDKLSLREKSVARLVADGLCSKAIAKKMNISVNTVSVHRKNIMRKLDVHSAANLAALVLSPPATPRRGSRQGRSS